MLTRNWRFARILFISTGLISGIVLAKDQFPLSWSFILMVLIVVPLMVLITMAMNVSRLPRFWNLPQWNISPFSIRGDPFQLIHVVAWQAIVAGAVGHLLAPWVGNSSPGAATFMLAFGVGFLFGIYLSVRIFRKRIRDKAASAKNVFLGVW